MLRHLLLPARLAVLLLSSAGLLRAGETMISPPGADDIAPAWAPDGRQIACLTKVGRERRICLLHADGSARRILPAPKGNASGVWWSRDGTRVAAVVENAGKEEIWLASAADGAAVRLGEGREPAFSPDGTALVYATDDSLRLVKLPGLQKRIVLSAPRGQGFGNPAWTPDSRGVVYAVNGSLYRVRPRENRPSRPELFVKHERYPYRRAIFSPDGSKVVLVGDSSVEVGQQAGDPLWLANPDGKAARRLPEGYSPAWTRDPNWPIVCARRGRLFLLGPGPGQKLKLTTGRAPAVAPDGKRIAFQRPVREGAEDELFGRTTRSKIFILNFDKGLPPPGGAPGAAGPGPSPEAGWTIRLPATADVGLKDRTNAIAHVDIDLPAALKQARLDVRCEPRSLRVLEKRGHEWTEVPSSVRIDPVEEGKLTASWLMPGKNEMLTLREYLLCFRPAGGRHSWIRPPEWQKAVPPPPDFNLIENPSFERMDKNDGARPVSWTITPPRDLKQGNVTVEATNPFHGKKCVRFQAWDRMATPAIYSAFFAMKPRTRYVCSFAVRSEITKGIPATVWVYFLDREKKRVSKDITIYRQNIRQPPPSKRWQTAKAVVGTPRGTAFGRIQVSLWRTIGSSWIDAFSLVPFRPRDGVRVTLFRQTR